MVWSIGVGRFRIEGNFAALAGRSRGEIGQPALWAFEGRHDLTSVGDGRVNFETRLKVKPWGQDELRTREQRCYADYYTTIFRSYISIYFFK